MRLLCGLLRVRCSSYRPSSYIYIAYTYLSLDRVGLSLLPSLFSLGVVPFLFFPWAYLWAYRLYLFTLDMVPFLFILGHTSSSLFLRAYLTSSFSLGTSHFLFFLGRPHSPLLFIGLHSIPLLSLHAYSGHASLAGCRSLGPGSDGPQPRVRGVGRPRARRPKSIRLPKK